MSDYHCTKSNQTNLQTMLTLNYLDFMRDWSYATELDFVIDNSLLLYDKSLWIKVHIKMWLWWFYLANFPFGGR